jgi:hypothetical protein
MSFVPAFNFKIERIVGDSLHETARRRRLERQSPPPAKSRLLLKRRRPYGGRLQGFCSTLLGFLCVRYPILEGLLKVNASVYRCYADDEKKLPNLLSAQALHSLTEPFGETQMRNILAPSCVASMSVWQPLDF